MTDTVAQSLASWALAQESEGLPDAVRAATAGLILDGLGCAIAAARQSLTQPAQDVALGLGGSPEATVIGRSSRVSAPAAALATGALLHALDFDDTHPQALVHATAAVLPAALAVAEQYGRSGAELLTAVAIGHDIACRLGALVPHGFHSRGLHATAVCGVIASAFVAARLSGLSESATVDAVGIAGSQAGGLLEFLATGSSTKQLHPGLAGHAGILAVRLAAAGASGPASVIEGEHGLLQALLGCRPDPTDLITDLGVTWAGPDVAIKPYPACHLLHSAVDAARAARRTHPDLTADTIESVVADIHPDAEPIVGAIGSHKVSPRSAYEAKFSLPWSVAALLIDGAVGVDTYTGASIARPEVSALAARISTRVTTSSGPAAAAPGHLEIRRSDGSILVAEATGQQTGPLDDTVVEKFLANSGGGPDAQAMAQRILALADEPSVPALVDAVDTLARARS